MITGYNTDIEHGGVIYHVQTEDKGLQTPIILSLVYTGGAILASKRSSYEDLIASGFDQRVLAERLQRQHKLICAAINAGRIEELKRMGDRLGSGRLAAPETDESRAAEPDGARTDSDRDHEGEQPVTETGERFAISEEDNEPLVISLLDEKPLRSGESVTLRIQLTKQTGAGRVPAAKANLTLKVLGSSFQPASTYSTTDSAGRAAVSITLPIFESGRAAILIRAEADGEVAELRRVIQPS